MLSMDYLRKAYSYFIDTLEFFLLAGCVFLVIYVFLFRPFQVIGSSMYPNFEDKEYVLTNIVSLSLSTPKRGDVVVFKAPADPDKDYIKRIIGTGNDTVSLKEGAVYVNGNLLDESAYLNPSIKTRGGSFLPDGGEVKVPAGEFFVLGDNRDNSSDSREWGFITKKEIIGLSFIVYWPLNRSKIVSNPF